MYIKLYSKDAVVRTMTAMQRTGRFAHTYILTGDKGFGKKTSALYIAMSLLCDNGNACGECCQCRRILSGQHPDVIIPEKDKRSKIYTVDLIREKVVADAIISPNDCDRKVYILPDCEDWKDASQDALLKVTEEPPPSVYFIFTARNKGIFLPTLISRAMCIEIPEADRESCRECLADLGKYSDEQIKQAVNAFGGNIGGCIGYLDGDEELTHMARSAERAALDIAGRNEYDMLAVLTEFSSDRENLRQLLGMIIKIVRDGSAMQVKGDTDLLGCSEKAVNALTNSLSAERLTAIYKELCRVSEMCTMNVNAAVAAAMLAGICCS
ncbi:MAG: hypothetical protein LIO69_03040 [Oscillospiraceae bacterium]|nr:hypothetical protein [Oscillospiraceae bacterium]